MGWGPSDDYLAHMRQDFCNLSLPPLPLLTLRDWLLIIHFVEVI